MAAIEGEAVCATAADGFAAAVDGFGAAAGLAVVWAPRAGASTNTSTVQETMLARSEWRECARRCWFMGFSKLVMGCL
jgi:hypothetical protein